jgi:hypothetical protein
MSRKKIKKKGVVYHKLIINTLIQKENCKLKRHCLPTKLIINTLIIKLKIVNQKGIIYHKLNNDENAFGCCDVWTNRLATKMMHFDCDVWTNRLAMKLHWLRCVEKR